MLFEEMDSERLCDVIMGHLGDSDDRVAIHAGHFYLACDATHPYPLCAEELMLREGVPEGMLQRARQEIGVFPTATFELARELCRRLRGRGYVFTLVNDWGHASLRRCARAGEVRRSFYEAYPAPQTLKAFHRSFEEADSSIKYLLMGPRKSPLVSEVWLRRCFAKRMKRSSVSKDQEGSIRFVGVECPVVTQGRVSCAGEVAELLLQLQGMGFTRLINFYPRVCKGFVKASSDVARELGLEEGMKAVQVALDCTGERSAEELIRTVDLTVG
jgi:hypothetical protein